MAERAVVIPFTPSIPRTDSFESIADVVTTSEPRTLVSVPVQHPRILAVGVGGAGANTLNHLGTRHTAHVRTIALNTDLQMLAQSQADERFCIGESLTQGRGTGGLPEVGEHAAQISQHHIMSLLRGADIVFVTAGLGGGTGTGAAPVVARMAREQGALTIGMVTLPFAFEGSRRGQVAQEGLRLLARSVDALILIPNNRLLQIARQGQTLGDAFALADTALCQGISGIVDIVIQPGLINVDFADVRAVLQTAGRSMLTTGSASGSDRANRAVVDAISGGWLDADIQGAQRVLINIVASQDLTLAEVTEVATRVGSRIDPRADCVFGVVIDPAYVDRLQVTLIAANLPL